MHTGAKRVALAILLLIGAQAFADLKEIRQDKLPNDPDVQSAYADVVAIESMVEQWSQTWRYSTPKEEVVARVNSSLSRLRKAAAASPENAELLLLAGLVAHYAYNLDVQESHSVAVAWLEKAGKLAPDDYRSGWFLGDHKCQAGEIIDGMQKFLSVENRSRWDQLPASFWDDYLSCANFANMPAHALQAADRANKQNPQNAGQRQFLVDASHQRFKTPDPATTYDPKDLWRADRSRPDVRFVSPVLGMEFSVARELKLSLSGLEGGIGQALIKTGPYPGKAGGVIPNIFVLVRPAQPGESLADFLKAMTLKAQAQASSANKAAAATAPFCPVQECLAGEIIETNEYKLEGDGHFMMVVFKRDEPDYPGLVFEEPMEPPKTEGAGMHYFHPEERLRRLPGTLYYLVALDTAESVLTQAKSTYSSFLKSMRLE